VSNRRLCANPTVYLEALSVVLKEDPSAAISRDFRSGLGFGGEGSGFRGLGFSVQRRSHAISGLHSR